MVNIMPEKTADSGECVYNNSNWLLSLSLYVTKLYFPGLYNYICTYNNSLNRLLKFQLY